MLGGEGRARARQGPVGSHIRGRRHLLSCRAADEGSSVFDADQEAMWFFDAAKEKRVQVS